MLQIELLNCFNLLIMDMFTTSDHVDTVDLNLDVSGILLSLLMLCVTHKRFLDRGVLGLRALLNLTLTVASCISVIMPGDFQVVCIKQVSWKVYKVI